MVYGFDNTLSYGGVVKRYYFLKTSQEGMCPYERSILLMTAMRMDAEGKPECHLSTPMFEAIFKCKGNSRIPNLGLSGKLYEADLITEENISKLSLILAEPPDARLN